MAICNEDEILCRGFPSVLENYEANRSLTALKDIVRKNAAEARMHAKGDLATHLKRLMNPAGASDLTVDPRCLSDQVDINVLEFICKDEVRVPASRRLLTGRSPVLDKMLTNGMLETTSSVISLPEISSTSLRSILEFLNTGDILRVTDWKSGLEILSAADFFLLSDVDRIVQDSLVLELDGRRMSSYTDPELLAAMLTTAMTFKALSHDKDIVLLQLARLLQWRWMVRSVACCLSEEAVDFILRHSNSVSKEDDRTASSLVEYFRFRGVVLWCVCNNQEETNQLVRRATPPGTALVEANVLGNVFTPSLEANELVGGSIPSVQADRLVQGDISPDPEEAIRLVDRAVPLGREELYMYNGRATESNSLDVTWLPRARLDQVTCAQEKMIQFFLLHQASKEAAMRVLVHIDWVRMPAPLFIKIVEPLKLLPDSKLVDIFRFYAIHRPIRVKLNWVHNKSYKVHNDEFVIEKVERKPGSAMCLLASLESDEVCVWRFSIEELETDVQLGFFCATGLERAKRIWNVRNNCSGALRGSGATVWARVVHWIAPPSTSSGSGELRFRHWHGSDLTGGDPLNIGPHHVNNFQQVEFRFHRRDRSCGIKVDNKHFGTIWRGIGDQRVYPVVSFGDFERGRVRLDLVSGFEIL